VINQSLQSKTVWIVAGLIFSTAGLAGGVANNATDHALVSDANSSLVVLPTRSLRPTDIIIEERPGRGGLMLLCLGTSSVIAALSIILSTQAVVDYRNFQIDRDIELKVRQLEAEVHGEARVTATQVLAEHQQERRLLHELGGMGLAEDRPSAPALPAAPPQRSAWDQQFFAQYGKYPDEAGLQPVAVQPQPQAIEAAVQPLHPQGAIAVSDRPATPGDLRVGRYAWVKEMEQATTILACGEQGSGKSGKVKYLINFYRDRGDEVWVIDPHCYYGQYASDIRLFGAGMNWKEVDTAMEDFIAEIQRRYKKMAEDPEYGEHGPFNEKRIILVCEEMYQWSKEVDEEILKRFATNALAATRKANMGILIVSQSDKVSMVLGKAASGNKDLLESTVAKIRGVALDDPAVQGNKRPAAHAFWKPSGADSPRQVDYPAWIR
jgi:hypothetical protein